MPNVNEVKTVEKTESENTVELGKTSAVVDEVDINKFTSDELKEYYEKAKGIKEKSNIRPPEKDINELAKKPEEKIVEHTEQKPIETSTEEKKPETEVKKEEIAKPEFNVDQMRQQIKDDLLAEFKKEDKAIAEEEKKKEADLLSKMTDEEARNLYDEDTAVYIKKLITTVKDSLKSELKEEIKKEVTGDIDPQIRPVLDTIMTNRIATHKSETIEKYPEFKDIQFQENLKPILKENADILDKEVREGRNPYSKLMELYYAKNINKIKEQSRLEGAKEAEEKMNKEKRTFVEGGGKPITAEAPDFDKMSSSEMEKYLPHKEG